MDFQTARQVLASHTLPHQATERTFLSRLRQGLPPIPGQVTSLLLALKVIEDNLQASATLERELAYALFLLAYESRSLFAAGQTANVVWPPLLDEDLQRIAIATHNIFARSTSHSPGEPNPPGTAPDH